MPWWERWPGRLEYELQALRDAGIPYERDEDAFKAGLVWLKLTVQVDDFTVNLVAKFPDSYPEFRFEIFADELELAHHQNPFWKNLCLLGRGTSNWHTNYTLAEFIQTQVPTVIQAGRSSDQAEVADIEEHQGEPISNYYPYQPNALLLVDSSWSIDPNICGGELVIGLEPVEQLVRGAVLEVRNGAGVAIVRADPVLNQRYPHQVRGRWVRSSEPIVQGKPEQFMAAVSIIDPRLANPKWQVTAPSNRYQLDIVGALFPEEVRWRENADGWVFLVRLPRRSKGEPIQLYFTRAARAGRSDLIARVPELAHLARQSIAVFGLGGIGAPSAIGFARAQIGELRVLDADVVDAGTSVRWPLGLSAAGQDKVETLKAFLFQNYPYVHVVGYTHRIGGTRLPSQPSESTMLSDMLDGVSLIYDATAELGVHQLLARLAAERGIPYIYAHTTPGAWGGLIARIQPGRTQGCWLCLRHAQMDGTIPFPLFDATGEVQPEGCASPTFTGSGFDVEQVANEGVRMAVGTLTGNIEGGYPDVDWDVAILALRDETGRRIAPQWTTYALPQHAECPLCSQR